MPNCQRMKIYSLKLRAKRPFIIISMYSPFLHAGPNSTLEFDPFFDSSIRHASRKNLKLTSQYYHLPVVNYAIPGFLYGSGSATL